MSRNSVDKWLVHCVQQFECQLQQMRQKLQELQVKLQHHVEFTDVYRVRNNDMYDVM